MNNSNNSLASIVSDLILLALKPYEMLEFLNLTQKVSLFLLQPEWVRLLVVIPWCLVPAHILYPCYHYHLSCPNNERAYVKTNKAYLRTVWRVLERESMSKKRLFLMVSLFTLPTEVLESLFIKELLLAEWPNKFMSFTLNAEVACSESWSLSMSATCFKTRAMYIPGECGINSTLCP